MIESSASSPVNSSSRLEELVWLKGIYRTNKTQEEKLVILQIAVVELIKPILDEIT